MPLPSISIHGAKRCHARAKSTANQCMNPTAYGCSTCRMHGARKPKSVKRGAKHPNYVHGKETLEAKAIRSEKLNELRMLEKAMFDGGFACGTKWRGRKPK